MKTFIDPASYSTGYAKFSDDYTLLESGTISSDLKDPFDRIWDIASGYIHLFPEAQEGDEVHIERMAEKTHYMVKWSVGCIGAVLAARKYKVDQAVDISSWQNGLSGCRGC